MSYYPEPNSRTESKVKIVLDFLFFIINIIIIIIFMLLKIIKRCYWS